MAILNWLLKNLLIRLIICSGHRQPLIISLTLLLFTQTILFKLFYFRNSFKFLCCYHLIARRVIFIWWSAAAWAIGFNHSSRLLAWSCWCGLKPGPFVLVFLRQIFKRRISWDTGYSVWIGWLELRDLDCWSRPRRVIIAVITGDCINSDLLIVLDNPFEIFNIGRRCPMLWNHYLCSVSSSLLHNIPSASWLLSYLRRRRRSLGRYEFIDRDRGNRRFGDPHSMIQGPFLPITHCWRKWHDHWIFTNKACYTFFSEDRFEGCPLARVLLHTSLVLKCYGGALYRLDLHDLDLEHWHAKPLAVAFHTALNWTIRAQLSLWTLKSGDLHSHWFFSINYSNPFRTKLISFN